MEDNIESIVLVLKVMIKYWLLFIGVLVVMDSCKKDPQIPAQSQVNCQEQYDNQSKLYGNLFKGNYNFYPICPQSVFPEKFNYRKPCMNPNNPYEFCYLKGTNFGGQPSNLYSLWKFNFCTRKNIQIVANVQYGPVDWSNTDWILHFNNAGGFYKIKSNGDSLIKLLDFGGGSALWNPSGNKFMYSDKYIYDDTGNLFHQFAQNGLVIGWLDDLHLLFSEPSSAAVMKYNIRSGNKEFFHAMEKVLYTRYNRITNEFYGNVDSMNYFKNLVHNISSGTTQYLSEDYYGLAFLSVIYGGLDNRIIVEQRIKDTMNVIPGKINQRMHIAIMNTDGTNLRRVEFPE